MTFTAADMNRLTGLVKTITTEQMNGDIFRISQDSICPVCGWKALEHPMCGRMLDHNNKPFLHVLCGGHRVEL